MCTPILCILNSWVQQEKDAIAVTGHQFQGDEEELDVGISLKELWEKRRKKLKRITCYIPEETKRMRLEASRQQEKAAKERHDSGEATTRPRMQIKKPASRPETHDTSSEKDQSDSSSSLNNQEQEQTRDQSIRQNSKREIAVRPPSDWENKSGDTFFARRQIEHWLKMLPNPASTIRCPGCNTLYHSSRFSTRTARTTLRRHLIGDKTQRAVCGPLKGMLKRESETQTDRVEVLECAILSSSRVASRRSVRESRPPLTHTYSP